MHPCVDILMYLLFVLSYIVYITEACGYLYYISLSLVSIMISLKPNDVMSSCIHVIVQHWLRKPWTHVL